MNKFYDFRDCCQDWLDKIAKLDDFSLIKEIQKGNSCYINGLTPRTFNYTVDYVQVNFKIPWNHSRHMTVSSKR